MNPKKHIVESILNPKKEKLINHLVRIVSGSEKTFSVDNPFPKYYEVWYYYAFNFRYVFIDNSTNFSINIIDEDHDQKFNLIKMIDDKVVTDRYDIYNKYRML